MEIMTAGGVFSTWTEITSSFNTFSPKQYPAGSGVIPQSGLVNGRKIPADGKSFRPAFIIFNYSGGNRLVFKGKEINGFHVIVGGAAFKGQRKIRQGEKLIFILYFCDPDLIGI